MYMMLHVKGLDNTWIDASRSSGFASSMVTGLRGVVCCVFNVLVCVTWDL